MARKGRVAMAIATTLLIFLLALTQVASARRPRARIARPVLPSPYPQPEVCRQDLVFLGVYCGRTRSSYHLRCAGGPTTPETARGEQIPEDEYHKAGNCPHGYACQTRRARTAGRGWYSRTPPPTIIPRIDCIAIRELASNKRRRKHRDPNDENDGRPSRHHARTRDFLGRLTGASQSSASSADTSDRSGWGEDLTLSAALPSLPYTPATLPHVP